MKSSHVAHHFDHLVQTNALRSVFKEELSQEIDAQRAGLKRLLDKKSRLGDDLTMGSRQLTQRYLFSYDALLRVIEFTLLQRYHLALGQQAHRGFKSVLFKLFPELDHVLSVEQLQDLVKTRHRAKKESLQPSADHDAVLNQVLSHVLMHTSQEFPELIS